MACARRCLPVISIMRRKPDVPEAGYLQDTPAQDLASMACGDSLSLRSVGIATINALLPQHPELWEEANAEQIIVRNGEGRRVVMVGHFPFVESLRSTVGDLIVLEKDPHPDDLPAEAAPEVIPNADVVAITAMTLTNHTLEGLLELCSPEAFVILMGPSTPLNSLFFKYGVDALSGAIVTDIDRVLRVVSQGGNFRQVHHAGVRLVNMIRPKSLNT